METKHLKTVEEVLRDEINSRTHNNWLSLCTEICIKIGKDTVFGRLHCYSEKFGFVYDGLKYYVAVDDRSTEQLCESLAMAFTVLDCDEIICQLRSCGSDEQVFESEKFTKTKEKILLLLYEFNETLCKKSRNL